MSDETFEYIPPPLAAKEGGGDVPVIEFHMMDKSRFVGASFGSAFVMRGVFYPLILIRSRLQVQKQNTVYRGFFHAVRSIHANEGFFGFYRGFISGSLYFFTPVLYTFSLEFSRHFLTEQFGVTSKTKKGVAAGMMATVVNSLVNVPSDVIMQYNMFLAKSKDGKLSRGLDDPLQLSKEGSRGQLTRRIIREVWRRDGLSGFYRGYFITVLNYGTNHGIWWGMYNYLPDHIHHAFSAMSFAAPLQLIKTLAAVSSTVVANTMTNWLEVARIRIQSQRMPLRQTLTTLFREEGVAMLWKGLHVRIATNIPFAVLISVYYEWLKNFALLPQYRDEVRWKPEEFLRR